jgi:hypothetical protein
MSNVFFRVLSACMGHFLQILRSLSGELRFNFQNPKKSIIVSPQGKNAGYCPLCLSFEEAITTGAMIPDHCVLYLVGAGAAGGAAFALNREPRLKRRTIDEVADFILDPDQEKLRRSFDPEEDSFWHLQCDRRIQRVRLELLRDSLTLTIRNVLVLHEWSFTEWFDNRHHELGYSPQLVATIEQLMSTSGQYLKVARSVRRRIHWRAKSHFETLPFMPVPQLTRYGIVNGLDLLSAYKTVGLAGEALAHAHENVEPVIRRIRLCFWTV